MMPFPLYVCPVRLPCTFHAVHFALYVSHCMFRAVRFMLYVLRCTFCSVGFALYVLRCSFCAVHFVLYVLRCMFCAVRFALLVLRCTFHAVCFALLSVKITDVPPYHMLSLYPNCHAVKPCVEGFPFRYFAFVQDFRYCASNLATR